MKFEGGWPVRDMLGQYLRNVTQRDKQGPRKIVVNIESKPSVSL